MTKGEGEGEGIYISYKCTLGNVQSRPGERRHLLFIVCWDLADVRQRVFGVVGAALLVVEVGHVGRPAQHTQSTVVIARAREDSVVSNVIHVDMVSRCDV
jgi:hypothetical protein